MLRNLSLHVVLENARGLGPDRVVVEREVSDAEEIVQLEELQHVKCLVVVEVQRFDTNCNSIWNIRHTAVGKVWILKCKSTKL